MTYTGSSTTDLTLRIDITDAHGKTATRQRSISVTGGGGGCNPFCPPDLKIVPENIEAESPEAFSLSQNYPNPFNPTTQLSFDLPSQSSVVLTVYNILGQEVAELKNEVMEAGSHTVNFDASGLTTGVYLARLNASSLNGESFIQEIKMHLVK